MKDPRDQGAVYTDFLGKVTSVQFSPNGELVASGDDGGKLKIWSYNSDTKVFTVIKEHTMLAGPVHTIAWTEDGVKISAAGEGKDSLAKAVLASSGTKVGDLFGPSKTVMSMEIRGK